MALFDCPDCGKEVSLSASFCPHCGSLCDGLLVNANQDKTRSEYPAGFFKDWSEAAAEAHKHTSAKTVLLIRLVIIAIVLVAIFREYIF